MSWGSSARHTPARKKAEKRHSDIIILKNPIKIIDRNSPEFLAIAASCTKPKDITVRHGMIPPSYRNEDVDSSYRYRKGSEHTTI